MAHLNLMLEAIDSLSPSERLKVMERILMHLRSEQETSRTVKNIRLTGQGVRTTQRIPAQDLSAKPYDMKGLGA
jgi:hypothetical protein